MLCTSCHDRTVLFQTLEIQQLTGKTRAPLVSRSPSSRERGADRKIWRNMLRRQRRQGKRGSLEDIAAEKVTFERTDREVRELGGLSP